MAASVWLLAECHAADNHPTAGEYPVKAAYLLNFTKFVEWPATAFTNATAPFVVGLVGDDPFGSMLQEAFSGQTVGGRPIVLRRFPVGAKINDCHVLFLSRSARETQEGLLATLQGRPILTVGETEQFLEAGGLINFVLTKERVRFEVNARSAERAGLKLGAKLLGVAARVLSESGGK